MAYLSLFSMLLKCLLVAPRATRDWGGRWLLIASSASKGKTVMGFTVCYNSTMMTQASVAVNVGWSVQTLSCKAGKAHTQLQFRQSSTSLLLSTCTTVKCKGQSCMLRP